MWYGILFYFYYYYFCLLSFGLYHLVGNCDYEKDLTLKIYICNWFKLWHNQITFHIKIKNPMKLIIIIKKMIYFCGIGLSTTTFNK